MGVSSQFPGRPWFHPGTSLLLEPQHVLEALEVVEQLMENSEAVFGRGHTLDFGVGVRNQTRGSNRVTALGQVHTHDIHRAELRHRFLLTLALQHALPYQAPSWIIAIYPSIISHSFSLPQQRWIQQLRRLRTLIARLKLNHKTYALSL